MAVRQPKWLAILVVGAALSVVTEAQAGPGGGGVVGGTIGAARGAVGAATGAAGGAASGLIGGTGAAISGATGAVGGAASGLIGGTGAAVSGTVGGGSGSSGVLGLTSSPGIVAQPAPAAMTTAAPAPPPLTVDDQDARTTMLDLTPWKNTAVELAARFTDSTGEPCRQFVQVVTIADHPVSASTVVCKRAWGAWKVVSPGFLAPSARGLQNAGN